MMDGTASRTPAGNGEIQISAENRALSYRCFGEPETVLALERFETAPLLQDQIRVRMSMSGVNPSDLIPMTGAYRHRVMPPLVAGYEGVGRVTDAPKSHAHLTGKRVLPLRGAGTWQDHLDCHPDWVVPVPDDIPDHRAARAYINPLAALLMLKRWSPIGRRIIVTAAGSTCASLLAQWSLASGARDVIGIYRSPDHVPGLLKHGIVPLDASNAAEIAVIAGRADLVFDAVGGALATHILTASCGRASFVSYGLLSGAPFSAVQHLAKPSRFHIRDQFDGLQPSTWQAWFLEIWSLLRQSELPEARLVPLEDWRHMLTLFRQPSRQFKPLLTFERQG